MKKNNPTVFFNASVILASLKSPSGGSAKLINWSNKGIIIGVTSEIVLDEIRRNLSKVNVNKKRVKKTILAFKRVFQAPDITLVSKYQKRVIDPGDAHILASCENASADYLVTLDKKHLLVLQKKIKNPRIVNPKELIEEIS